MRYFFGLDVDASNKLDIESWRDKIFPELAAPVPAANFHVTLHFLGSISSHQVEQLHELCSLQADSFLCGAIDLHLDTLGYWPKPKALWLGSSALPGKLKALVKAVKRLSHQAHIQPKGQHDHYIPHVTIYRKCAENPPSPAISPNFQLKFKHLVLFESVSAGNGVAYIPRANWPLFYNL